MDNCIYIDPNKRDLLYISDGIKDFRYTNQQRSIEVKSKKYTKIRKKLKTKEIQQIENELSRYSKKSWRQDEFLKYLDAFSKHYSQMDQHYKKPIFKKLRLNGYINKQRTENKLINNIKCKYGPNPTIIFGDKSAKHHMKFHPPTKGVGFVNLFRKWKFKVLLIDEFRSSCFCLCGHRVETFMTRPSPRPWRKRALQTVHGLLRCTNDQCFTMKDMNSLKGRLWNRDKLAVLNFKYILENYKLHGTRPTNLSRAIHPDHFTMVTPKLVF